MTGCTLKILDPTLKFFLGKGTFDSYEEFRNVLLNKVDNKLIPIGKEIKKIELSVSPPGYSVLVGNNVMVFESLETLVNQMLAGLLETNDPNSQFSSFIQTADIYHAKYNSPEFITEQIKARDLDFLESTLDFYTSYPVDQEFKNSDLYQEFLERTVMVREVISNLRKVEVEPVLITDESTFQEEITRAPYVFTLTKFYTVSPEPVYESNDPLAIIRHKVAAKVEQLMKSGKRFYMRMEPDNESNVQTVPIADIKKYGVVGVLYDENFNRIYVKSNDNNVEGNIEFTTNPNEAIVLDKNDSKNLSFTLPDLTNPNYFVRDNPMNQEIAKEIIRVRTLAKTEPSAFYEINQIDSQLPVSPPNYKEKRLITLREFLDKNNEYRLEIASETDRVLYAGNLFVRFANEQKAALNRTTLSDSWKQRVIDLVNHDYSKGGLEDTKNSLNALLEYKGGDISFGKKGNRITVWRKSIKTIVDGKPTIMRLEHAKEVPTSELAELSDYAKINVDQNLLKTINVDFPIIKNGKLDFTTENFVEFYKDHHKTIARQVLVNGKYYFTPVKSLQFDIQSPEAKKIEDLGIKLESPKIGDLEIVPDTEMSLTDVVNNLTSIANETTDATRDILILLNALLDNDEIKGKFSNGTIRFTTSKGKDFKGLVTNGKDVEINYALLSNINLLGDVLAHEIIHVLTQRWLLANPNSKIKQDLDALLLLVPDTVPGYNKRNVFELLGSISNPEVANELKKVIVQDKNLLEKLIDLFKELIGKIFGVESLEPTLYNEIVNKLVVIGTSPMKAQEQPVAKNKFGLKKRGDGLLPLGYSEEDLQQFYKNNNVSKSFLNLLVKSIDGDLAQYIHNKGLFQEFLAGKVDFTTAFRSIFDSYVDAADAKESYTAEEETFFNALADSDFIEEYWIANTNFAKVRKPKKGEQDKTAKEPVLEIDTNDNEEEGEVLVQEDAKPVSEDQETIDQMIQEGGNEDKLGAERGTDKSSLELADPMTRAFVKMLPKVERVNGHTKVYTKEEYEKSNDKQNFVLVKPDTYIKFSHNELGRIELCDYTPTWNLIALNLKNKLSIKEMLEHIDSDPKLIDVVPEIYIFKERLNQPVTNEFKAIFKGAVETAFKKAGVSIFAIIHDTKTGNFLVKDESADFTMTAKQKINTQFINNVQTARLSKYYNSVNSTFRAKDYFKDKGLINQSNEKNIQAIDKDDKFLEDLGFVLNVKTMFENGNPNGFRRFEVQNFKQELVGFLIQFEEIEARIADFVTEDHGKIKGLNNWFKSVYEIENENNPLVTTTMVKNAEGENQSVLSLYNGILQDRESYNKSKTEQELVEKIDRTRNDVFQYSITKKQLFRSNEKTKINERTDVTVLVDILSGLKVTEEGSATKGNLTINLEDAEWLKLNFVGMLKKGIIENTRAETASTSYTFRLSDWSNKAKKQDTPFTIMEIKDIWDSKARKFDFSEKTSSEIYKAWSDYLKGELSRISKVGIRLNRDGSQAEQFGIYADILNKQDKEVLLDLLNKGVGVDKIVEDNSVLVTNALDRFFNKQFEEYNDLFENVMGGYSSILGNLTDKSVDEKDKRGDVEIYNKVFNSTNSGDYREDYKAFFVINALTLHTEESILFQGDLTESPKYFKRAKGVQSTGTPLSTSEDLQGWVNNFLQQYSFASIIGSTSTVGKTFDSATIEDDVKKSHYHSTGQLQKGYADSKKLYNEQIGKSQTDQDLQEEAEKLLADYAKNNIGDGDGKVTPDFYFALLTLVGNITEEQIIGFKALQLDARKNASKYNLGQDQQLTKEEELLMNEGLSLISEGKVVFPKLKVTYRGNALTNHPVSKEIMDKFALFPLFPQFTYDKPAAHHLLKTMMKEGKAYTKFESGTKIQNLGKTKFLEEVEKGNFNVTLEDSQHTLFTEKLREQIKTPHKTKEKNTFGSQFRKLVISGLTALGKPFKLSTEETAGETVRQWEKLNQELSELTKEEVLKEFGISKVGDDWNYSQMNFPKVADLLLRESERKDLPDNIKVYFDKYKKGKLNQSDVDNYYKLFETSFGSQQIQSLIASIIKKISVQKLSGAQLIQVSQSIYDRQVKAEGKTRDLGFYHFKDGKVQAAECKVSLIGDFKNLLNLQEVKDRLKGIENPNVLEQTRALNDLLQSDSFVEKYKDQLTIIGYRIPTQGFNSMEVMVIREFLPTFHGPTIVCPPEITTQSGTDYDYDKLSVIFPSIDNQGRHINYENVVPEYTNLEYEVFKQLKEDKRKDVSLLKDEKDYVLSMFFTKLKELKKDKTKVKEYKDIYSKFIDFQVYYLNYEISERESIIYELKNDETANNETLIKHNRDNLYRLVEAKRNLLNAKRNENLEYQTFKENFDLQVQDIKQGQWERSFEYSDRLRERYDDLTKLNTSFYNHRNAVQNGMIKVSAQILLDPINYHRLVTPNTNAIIFDFLKGTKDTVGLLERLGISTKEYKNTEVLTMLVNLIKFKAVKGKGLLGIAAVWNTFTSLIQRHNWMLNPYYTKSIGFGENQREVDVDINPVLLKNKPTQINASKPDTENGQSKQEIISQLINVTVDMPSDDTFGKSIFNKSDFGALTYGISMLGYDFETSMLFFHQPVVYQYKRLVRQKIQEGLKPRVARFEAASELLGIEIPLDKKTGAPLWVEFEDRLFHQTTTMESRLNINELDKDIKPIKEIPDVKIDTQQKAVLSHYLKLLDQASQIRTVQSAINFDTAPENSMYKVEERIKNRDEAIKVNIINDEYLQEIERDSVVSGLNITSILSNVAKQLFPVLFNAETSSMFSSEAREYVGKEELAYRKVTNDFLLSILQNYGNYNGRNVYDVAASYIRGENFLDFYKKGNEVKQILNKEGFNPRLLNILLLNSSKKKKNLNNPQLLLGFENTPEDKNKITEEWRTMLNSSNKEVKEFAETLAIIGIVQSGWAKSPIYFSDLIPEEFITPIISKAFDQYTQLGSEQQKEFRDKFIKLFKLAEGKSLGRKGRDYQVDSYRLIDYTIALEQPIAQSNRQTEFEEDFSDEFEVDFGVTEKEGLLYELNDTQQLHPKDRFKHDGNLQTTLSKLLNIKERNSNNDYYLQTINTLISITNRLIQIESEPTQPQSDIFLDYVDQLNQEKTYFSYQEDAKIKEIISKAVEKLPVRYFATSHGNYQIHRSDNQDQILASSISLNEMFTISDKPYVLEVHKMDAGSKYHTSLKKSLLVVPKLRAVIDHSFSSHAKGLDIVFGSKLKNTNTFSRYEPDFDNIELVSIPVSSVLDVDFTTIIEAPVDQLDPLNIGPLRGEQYDRRILIRDAKEKNLSTQDIENIQKELDEIDAEIEKRIKLEQQGEDFKSTLNKVEYQYYGAKYNILVDNNNKGIDVEGYAGKSKNKQKLLDAYNSNPNVDPQNGKPFRTVEQPITEQKPVEEVSFEFKDGFKVKTNFLLNKEQQDALYELAQFVSSKENTITLSGYAGTGKSTLMSILNEWLEKRKHYPKYSAPTHRANAVTKLMNPKVSVYTLHSLFGLSPDLDIETGNFDVKKLEFIQKNRVVVNNNDILIIDESSMISDPLFELIKRFQQTMGLKVIYVGDLAQLKPVKQKHKSKVFTSASHKVLQLTKVERTGDNAVLEEATNIRNGKDWNYQTKVNSKGEGVVYVPNDAEFLDIVEKEFKHQADSDNKLYFRVLAATNRAVSEVNQAVRRVLYPDEFQKQLVVGDIIMGYDNFDYNYDSKQYQLYNSGDYQIMDVSPLKTKTISEIGEIFQGYEVTVKSLLNKKASPYRLFVVDNNEDVTKAWKFADYIQQLQISGSKAMAHSPREAAQLFGLATTMKKQLAFMKDIDKMDSSDSKPKTVIRKTFDYGYAHTIHKSQGGTYDKIMLLIDGIETSGFDKSDQEELNYVGISRARLLAYLRTNKPLKEPQIQSTETTTTTTDMSQLVNHSGGAYGGDTFWDIIGRLFGVTEHKHYRDSGNQSLSKQLRDKKITATVLSKEQMDKARTALETLLGKKYPDTLQGNLQVRNYYQVVNSDAVYAVAQLDINKNFKSDAVFGGTNTAVQLGIKLNKPVYVWDISTKGWYKFDVRLKQFEPTETPRLTKNFAGVGSRDIENYNVQNKETGAWEPRKEYVGKEKEEKAKQAIRDVYERTRDEGVQEVVKSIVQTAKPENLWSGSSDPFAAALTNPTTIAKRKGKITQEYPVTFRGKTYEDVEAAYKSNKVDDLVLAKQGKIDPRNNQLMVEVIVAKLQQYPKLVNELTKRGGTQWLEQSEHTVNGNRFEGKGRSSPFMQNLITAYEQVISGKQQGQLDLFSQSKTDRELINDYVTKVLTGQITPAWIKLGTPINTDRLRTNDSIPELVGLLKNKIKELETKLDEYEQDAEKFKDAIINVSNQIQGYGSLVYDLENLRNQIPPLGYDEQSTPVTKRCTNI